jgi:cytochrome d ubiquinol oxidase subunit II
MIEIWYGILSFMLVMFLVLEGFDFGAGMLQPVVGKTEAERRLVIAAIGPLWSWHEVWLVGFGGTLLVAFPSIMTATFAGFYLAFFLLLWAIVLRGVSIEVSGHINDSMWRTGWNFIFVVSNVLLSVLVGAALGNVLRGVPMGPDGKFALSFFTDFTPYGKVGILDWYTVSAAVFIVITLAAHGANGLMVRTEGPVHDRSRRMAGLLWKIVPVLLAIITVESYHLRPALFSGIMHSPFGWLGLAGVFGGLVLIFAGLRARREKFAFIGSCAFIAGLMIAGAAGAFPIMLYSTLAPENSLSAYQMAAAGYGLAVALVWWPIAAIFAAFYFVFIYKHYSSKVKPTDDTQRPY